MFDVISRFKGYSKTYDILYIRSLEDLENIPRSLCKRHRAPDAWVVDPSSPEGAVELFEVIYNSEPRSRAAVDSGAVDADPLLILMTERSDESDERFLELMAARLYKRFSFSEGMDPPGVSKTIHVFSAAPSSKNEYLRIRRDLVSSSSLVLDLNGVLLDKLFDPKHELPAHLYHARFGKFAIITRPGAFSFLCWAVANFSKVVVWSSLRRENAEGVFVQAFGEELRSRLAGILGNEDSPRDEENPEMREGRNCAILKDLRWLSGRVPGVDPARTVIIDDSEVKVRKDADRALVIGRAFTIRELVDPSVVNDRVMPEVLKPAILSLLWLSRRFREAE